MGTEIWPIPFLMSAGYMDSKLCKKPLQRLALPRSRHQLALKNRPLWRGTRLSIERDRKETHNFGDDPWIRNGKQRLQIRIPNVLEEPIASCLSRCGSLWTIWHPEGRLLCCVWPAFRSISQDLDDLDYWIRHSYKLLVGAFIFNWNRKQKISGSTRLAWPHWDCLVGKSVPWRRVEDFVALLIPLDSGCFPKNLTSRCPVMSLQWCWDVAFHSSQPTWISKALSRWNCACHQWIPGNPLLLPQKYRPCPMELF